MKKFVYASTVLLLAVGLSACGDSADSETVDPSTSSSPAASAPAVTAPASSAPASSAPTNAPDAAAASYYGEWKVEKDLGSTPVSTGVDKNMIGKTVVYTKDKATFDNKEIANPEYKEADITKEDFLKDYQYSLSDLGISSDSAKTLNIDNWTNAGNFLVIKDDQTMIFLWDGTFYEMKKVK